VPSNLSFYKDLFFQELSASRPLFTSSSTTWYTILPHYIPGSELWSISRLFVSQFISPQYVTQDSIWTT